MKLFLLSRNTLNFLQPLPSYVKNILSLQPPIIPLFQLPLPFFQTPYYYNPPLTSIPNLRVLEIVMMTSPSRTK